MFNLFNVMVYYEHVSKFNSAIENKTTQTSRSSLGGSMLVVDVGLSECLV